jgi:hypothetical protein
MSKQGRYIGGFYDLNITNPGNGRIVTSTGGSGLNGSSNFLITNDLLSGSSSSSGLPSILLSNSNDDASSGSIAFTKIPWLFGDPGVGDKIGELKFYGIDSGDSGLSSYPTEYGNIVVKSVNVTATDEAGSVNISAACSNGTTTALQQGFLATGHGTSNKVDIGLGYGTASVTTVAGTLTVGTTAFVDNVGRIQVASQPNITSVGTLADLDIDNININGDTITASADLTIVATGNDIAVDTDNFVIESATSAKPVFELKNTTNDTASPELKLTSTRGTNAAEVGQYAGIITFAATNDAQQGQTYGNIITRAGVVADGEESGFMYLKVASHDGDLGNGLEIMGGSVDSEVDVTIATGAASVTTIAGTLTMGLTAAMTNAGLLSVAAQTNITSVGTLTGLTTSGAIELGHASDTTITRTAAGKIAVEGVGVALVSNTARQVVSLRTDDQYVIYLGSVNRWYQANRVFSSIGTQSTLDGESVTDSIAIAAASYIAIRPCTVHSVIVSWYPSQSSAIEFEILKVPLVDNSTSNVTFAQMTHTDHNASYTANTNYVKTFAITGGNTLTAGQGIALAARRTSGNATYFNAGQIYAEIEITG